MRMIEDGDHGNPDVRRDEYLSTTITHEKIKKPIKICKIENSKSCKHVNRAFVIVIAIISLFLWFFSTNNLYTYLSFHVPETLSGNAMLSAVNVLTFMIFVYTVVSVVKAKEINVSTAIILFSVVISSNVIVLIFFPIPVA